MAMSQGTRVVSEAGRGTDPPLEPPEGASLADTLILVPKTHCRLLTFRNCKIVNPCCLGPLWCFVTAAVGVNADGMGQEP